MGSIIFASTLPIIGYIKSFMVIIFGKDFLCKSKGVQAMSNSFFKGLSYVSGCLIMLQLWTGCDSMEQTLPMNIPNSEALLDQLVIDMNAPESRVYAFTDGVGGFWQGSTFAYNSSAGYNTGNHNPLRDFLIFSNDTLLDRKKATRSRMFPHQMRHDWADGHSETITVLSDRMGMIISVDDPHGKPGTLIPVFSGTRNQWYVDIDDSSQVALFKHKARDMWTAVYSKTLHSWSAVTHIDSMPNVLPSNDIFIGQKGHVSRSRECHWVVLFGRNHQVLKKEIQQIVTVPGRHIDARKKHISRLLSQSYFKTDNAEYDKALHWAKIAGNDLVVQQFGKGIWAGLPWFNQSWGRDTFIALPGVSLVTGQFAEAASIIRSFAQWQITDPQNPLYGRIPNRVLSPENIIYNTTDGTPWLIREIAEYVCFTGDTTFARDMFPVIEHAINGSQRFFMDSDGFLTHDDADTWMDARIRGEHPWSPRGNRAVEIQALWYNQLQVSAYMAKMLGYPDKAKTWNQLAENVKTNFNRLFYDHQSRALYDHLNTDDSPDDQIRPNQMFALTVPLLDDLISSERAHHVVNQVVSTLTYPYGVASLSQNDPYFHPYHHDQIYHFDAAYHNGLCWQWIAGPVVSGMVQTGYTNKAFELSGNLAHQVLHKGMPGSMSELVEPAPAEDGSLVLSGTYSQAWSVSEFVRNFYQDYLGLQVNMLHRELNIKPALPDALNHVVFIYNLGLNEQIECAYIRNQDQQKYTFYGKNLKAPLKLNLNLTGPGYNIYHLAMPLQNGQKQRLRIGDFGTGKAQLNNQTVQLNKIGQIPKPVQRISFQTFQLNPDLKTIRVDDYLENIRLNQSE
ncbi:MAG: hypothetical protein GF313_02490 [Caldithrix sp.]|nr:hypothetical protein [Caldithrix sp.]